MLEAEQAQLSSPAKEQQLGFGSPPPAVLPPRGARQCRAGEMLGLSVRAALSAVVTRFADGGGEPPWPVPPTARRLVEFLGRQLGYLPPSLELDFALPTTREKRKTCCTSCFSWMF